MSSPDSTLLDQDDIIVPDEGVYGDGYPAVRTNFAEQFAQLQRNYEPIAQRHRDEQAAFERQVEVEKKVGPILRNALDGHLRDPEDFPTDTQTREYVQLLLQRIAAVDNDENVPSLSF